MRYEVKLRSRLMLERALTLDGADCDPDDYDFDMCELAKSDVWFGMSSILTDEAGTELVFTDENGDETAVSLSVESPVVETSKTADDEEPLKKSTFVRCLYWKNQERPYENEDGESILEADGIVPRKITVGYKMVRDENNELVPVLNYVKFDGEYMEFGTEEGDGYDARQTIINQKQMRNKLATTSKEPKKATATKKAAVAQWNYCVKEGKARIDGVKRWLCAEGDLEIPETLDGCPVTSIRAEAFKNCSGLTSVTIPASVTSIGRNAFLRCRESLFDKKTIPGVKLVDGWVVGYAGSLAGDLNLAGIRGIVNKAFNNCRKLKSVTIGNGVTSIGDNAFYKCEGLTSVTIGNGVTSIGGNAFCECTNLTSVTIPNSVTSIGESAFFGCSGLTSVTIPNSVTCIKYATFCSCSGLTSVTIPNSVTSIEDTAFMFCIGLTSVTIPGSVTIIGENVFNGCTGLASITIPDSVRSIGEYAFNGCTNLTSVTLPKHLEGDLPEDAFEGCSDDLKIAYRDAAAPAKKPAGKKAIKTTAKKRGED